VGEHDIRLGREVDPRLTVSGAVLTHSGVVVPGLHPESALVLGLVVRP
jgi:hypothetical protein